MNTLALALLFSLPALAQANEPVVEDFKASTLNQPGGMRASAAEATFWSWTAKPPMG